MGLTLHYTLVAPVTLAAADVPDLVRAMRAVAERFRTGGRVTAVTAISRAREDLEWCTAWLPVRATGGVRGLPVPPRAGFLFLVDPGEGAERLRLGLCAYPENVDDPVTALRAHLDRLNGAIAGLAGALKDAADDAGTGPVRAPIFAHPEFERLEADGVSAHAADLARAMALIRPPE